ncbi:hypothetical protein [Phocaeicola oris]|uniref:hypothetical protein n=1 Tax=Phocaeicola oris TaxID=2896850 RepID=UPI00234E4656|nr:hypothetical protein [Phocaeicola oris]MCE2617590.1 hypothetical protein [Phocaeicola oris]
MKKHSILLSLFATASLLVGCQNEIDIDKSPTSGTAFTASIEGTSDTRTSLKENSSGYDVMWTANDEININRAVFSTSSDETKTASFTLKSGTNPTSPYKAYYPANIYNGGTPVLPAEQTYAADNISGYPMYAESETGNLNFKNLCGILRLNLGTTMSGMKVKKIIVSADQGMSGPFTITSNAAVVSGTAGVTLNCPTEGVAIEPTAAIPFYIAVPANTYTRLNIILIATDGTNEYRQDLTLKPDKSIKVERSKISDINLTCDFSLVLSAGGKNANTYIYSAAGKYCFDATVKGNGGLDPVTNAVATKLSDISGVTVLWELYSQGRAIKYDPSSAYDISYSNGYVFFRSPDTFIQGDAYIAVYKDGSGGTAKQYDKANDEILWSWLIWATPEPGTMSHNSKDFMDRNLGGIEVDNYIRGFLYQWGRKDPFSAANGGFSPYSFIPAISSVFSRSVSIQSMAYTIAHPTTFILLGDRAWMSESEYTMKFWNDDVKTIYDPCPYGWRVPTKGNIDGISELPDTGLTDGAYNSTPYHGFGNPETGYYRTSTQSAYPNAWSFCNDGRNLMDWETDTGYAIRPVKE